jgi:hypothetical protein
VTWGPAWSRVQGAIAHCRTGPPGDRLRRPSQGHRRDRTRDTHAHVRTDPVDTACKITLRHAGVLHSIGIGRTHARTRVLILVEGLHIRVIDAATGELLRELVLDTTKDYQPTGAPKGPTNRRTPRT